MKNFVYTVDITSDMLKLDNTEPMSANKVIVEYIEREFNRTITKLDPIDTLIATGKLTLHEAQMIRELQRENKRLKDEVEDLQWEVAEARMGEDF
ncbi:hypothetical protein [Bacillus sp. GZT]|uniref:hypothetical protein n=1 Tax=Bacillus sp. GZT TaxID=936600 RepID=UPI0007A0A79F|nr:hypothetical protein [Bacillus sp. GZT]KYZ67936.1 hypothetical protein A3782_17690 [Bacillus sp. GZT]